MQVRSIAIQAHQFRRLDSAQFSIPTHQNRSRKPVESRRFLTRCAMPEHTTQKMSCTTTERVGQLCRPTGTAVKAMEAGTVIAAPTGYGPASTPYPGCQGAPGNYAKIQGADKYFTIYFHMKPIVGVGPPVSAGQVIGYLDNSGCHRRPPPRGQKRSVGKSRQFYDPLCQHRSNNPVLRWGRGGWRSRQSLTCTTL